MAFPIHVIQLLSAFYYSLLFLSLLIYSKRCLSAYLPTLCFMLVKGVVEVTNARPKTRVLAMIGVLPSLAGGPGGKRAGFAS